MYKCRKCDVNVADHYQRCWNCNTLREGEEVIAEPVDFTFRSVVFWRNVVGICFLLMAIHPRLYNNATMFVGVWLGELVITFGGAGVVTGLCYLFFTKAMRDRFYKVLIIVAWLFALLQVGSSWVLPDIIQKISVVSVEESLDRAAREIAFRYVDARKAGISDEEIVSFLESKHGDTYAFSKAKNIGWSSTDIVNYLIRKQRIVTNNSN